MRQPLYAQRSILPLIAQRSQLACELGQVFVGETAACVNESHEAFAGLFEPYVRCGFLLCDSRPCLFFVLFDRDSLCLKKNFVGSEIIDGSRIRSHRIPSELLVEIFRKGTDDRVVAVYNEALFRGLFDRCRPVGKTFSVGVGGDAGKLADFRRDRDRLCKELDLLFTFEQSSTECALCLIADKEDR